LELLLVEFSELDELFICTEEEDVPFLEEEEGNFSSGVSGISRLDLQEKSRKTQSIIASGMV